MDAYIWVTDDVLQLIRVHPADNSKIKKAQDILHRIFTRDLYKLIVEKKITFQDGNGEHVNGRKVDLKVSFAWKT
jgi:hypothetical protein